MKRIKGWLYRLLGIVSPTNHVDYDREFQRGWAMADVARGPFGEAYCEYEDDVPCTPVCQLCSRSPFVWVTDNPTGPQTGGETPC